ncbi:hypothetical protein B0H14DRAFT_2628917 [Mycena olivaceomarginata]|nr:hypothetical protein B0H14DRAFT_2628917 [Mycena olivaceomarginata]
MPMGTRAPPPLKIGTDSAATLKHPDDHQRFTYGCAAERGDRARLGVRVCATPSMRTPFAKPPHLGALHEGQSTLEEARILEGQAAVNSEWGEGAGWQKGRATSARAGMQDARPHPRGDPSFSRASGTGAGAGCMGGNGGRLRM